MSSLRLLLPLASITWLTTSLAAPRLDGVGAAMENAIDASEIAGAVTVVAAKDRLLHVEATGYANRESKTPIAADMVAWIASMTKPVTAVALLMLQDEGKLNVADPVAKYIPEFAQLKTPSGAPANLTITQIMTHVSGLGEATGEPARNAKTLSDLIPLYLAARMQYEPGSRWNYTQSGINTGARIVEIVSGMSFDAFLETRIFAPLGMKDTTFYPTEAQQARLITPYRKNPQTGALEKVEPRHDLSTRARPPMGNGGLYSTALDYARFCQMLLNRGTFEGIRYLTDASFAILTTPQTGDLPTGFFRPEFGAHYGWGLGTCVLRTPHAGAASVLSPGTFGHGGAWGTQAWVDPVKGVAYILIVQRANHPNSDGSDFRRTFQEAAAATLGKTRTGS